MKKILLIEDDKKFRILFGRLLDKKFGIIIKEACDSEKGLALFKEIQPDIVFLDIDMPGMNGVELLKKIKEINKFTRVVMISNIKEKEVISETIIHGIEDYIIKADHITSLQERLEKILGRSSE